MPATRTDELARCVACETKDIRCVLRQGHACDACEENGISKDDCKPGRILTSMKRFSSAILPTLVPSTIKDSVGAVFRRFIGTNVFLIYQVATVYALFANTESRERNDEYNFAMQCRRNALLNIMLVTQGFATLSSERPEMLKAVYLYCWLSSIIELELCHYDSRPFAVAVSEAILNTRDLYRPLTPFIAGLHEMAGIRDVMNTRRTGLTEAELYQAYPFIVDIRRLCGSLGQDPRFQMHCELMASQFCRAARIMEDNSRDASTPPDDRPILRWLLFLPIRDSTWRVLDVIRTDLQGHAMWWVLLANWAVLCHNRSSTWYMRGIFPKIMADILPLFNGSVALQSELWTRAMAAPVRVFNQMR